MLLLAGWMASGPPFLMAADSLVIVAIIQGVMGPL